jgi:flagellar hook protein FlgE
MLDSLFVGISGIRSHQTRMNSISNNVANINTTGYKASRVNFADVIGLTLSEGSGARGQVAATNPLQSGLGAQVSSIDTILQQGSLQSTGVDTDLAIEGEGFFLLSDGTRKFYTRDGTFSFDAAGKLTDPGTGMVVQGNLANADGSFTSEVEKLVIPLDRESKAQATTRISLSGNLDISASGQGESVWTTRTRFGKPASLTGTPASLDFSSLQNGGLKLTIDKGGQVTESTLVVPPRVYKDRVELVAALNSQLEMNGTLKGQALFKTNDLGQLILRTVEGGEQITIKVDNADSQVNVVSPLGFTANAKKPGTKAANTDLINDAANVGQDLTDGDLLRFSGTKPNGEHFDGSFVFNRTKTDKLADLFRAVESVYGGVQAGLDPDTGELILTEQASGDRVVGFDVQFSLLDAGNGSGIFGDNPPYEYSTNTQVYDAKGNVHSLTTTFTRSTVANEWSWVSSVDGMAPAAGNNGKVVFNEDGTLRSFEAADKSPLVFQPSGGTPELRLEIAASGTDQLGGLTQFVASSSVSVREQDGHGAGRLQSITIENSGEVKGLFSNGDSQVLGRVVLAGFGNPAGLKRQGDNFFIETEASGQAVVGAAGTAVQGQVRSGSIELSNVDLASEFTSMMVTQRGFQASARSITTADEMLTELVNLKR